MGSDSSGFLSLRCNEMQIESDPINLDGQQGTRPLACLSFQGHDRAPSASRNRERPMPSSVSARSEPPAPPRPGHAALASAVARYADRVPPSVTDMRAAVATFVGEFRGRAMPEEQMIVALRACVDAHAPRRLDADERVALTQLLVRWAIEVHRTGEASSLSSRA